MVPIMFSSQIHVHHAHSRVSVSVALYTNKRLDTSIKNMCILASVCTAGRLSFPCSAAAISHRQVQSLAAAQACREGSSAQKTATRNETCSRHGILTSYTHGREIASLRLTFTSSAP